MAVREWDGASYDRISGPQKAMGLEVLDRLTLTGDEVVLDAGCGSGRITEVLVERLPRGRAIGFDESPSMVAAARERLGPAADVRVGDLLELHVEEPLDAILSTATFHWIADHEKLFGSLRRALKPGGRLVAQCGGEGNIDGLRAHAVGVMESEPYAEHLRGWKAPWNYAAPRATEERLLAAGFTTATCWLAPYPVRPDPAPEYLRTIIFEPHLRALPPQLRDGFMADVLRAIPDPPLIDYVRLNIDALA